MALPTIHSYFSLDEVGAEEEMVPVTFATSAFALREDDFYSKSNSAATGNFTAMDYPKDSSDMDHEIAVGSTITMPLWAAAALRMGGCVLLHPPPCFTTSAFRQFKTDALAPSLYLLSPYYYDVGLTLCSLLGNRPAPNAATASARNNEVPLSVEGRRLAAQLFRLYQLRYLKIITATAKRGFDLSDVREKLVESERGLLDALLRGRAQEKLWYDYPI